MPSDAKNPHADSTTSPVQSVHHDVLVINPNHELYRFNVQKTDAGRVGEYHSVEYLGPGAPGHRKVMHIARKGSSERARGAAFATLPVKEEPASSYVCCYLINSENINYRNVWTQAEWNDSPGPDDDGLTFHSASDRDLNLLIAEHGGRVLRLHVPRAAFEQASQGWVLRPAEEGESPNLQAIPLKDNPEVWNLLRNGCVAGNTLVSKKPTPIVNVTSLVPCRERSHPSRPPNTGDGQITGTLDFKWPRRDQQPEVVVAFLPTHGAYGQDQKELFKTFEDCARRWLTSDVGIKVHFEKDRPFDPERPIDYDILVSLEPLDGRVCDELGRPVEIPQSELGNYARRVDRGVATMYVGQPQGLLDRDRKVMDSGAYPASEAFQHFVVHEFGHALGLTHLHQSPALNEAAMELLRNELGVPEKDERAFDAAIIELIHKELGIRVPRGYPEEAVRGRWPGNDEYSEWPKIDRLRAGNHLREWLGEPLEGAAREERRSVMCGLAAHAEGQMSGIAPNQYLVGPSQLDLDWLQQLYPSR
jgi:hypothetical protein